jgi:hypothetical protein
VGKKSIMMVSVSLFFYALAVFLSTAVVISEGTREGNALPAIALTIPWGLFAAAYADSKQWALFITWMAVGAIINGSLFFLIVRSMTRARLTA